MTSSTMRSADEESRFAEAVGVANIPTLLMVLVQLTGDLKWLDAPYAPQRASGMGDNDSGGLPPEIQAEVREASLKAILQWKRGQPVAMEAPAEDLLVRMLAVSMGEHVPPEYGGFTAAQLGQTRFLDHPRFNLPAGFKVLVIGAGVSGLCAAINLQMAGVPFEVVERNPTVGGVWWENRYPGAGVDTPNHLYSYSFAEYDWEKFFCLRDELHGYLEYVSREFDVRKYISFGTTVTRITYDADRQTWSVETRDADGVATVREANVVISAAGLFNPPIEPDIPGLETWSGEKWHTARWPDNGTVANKRVAIIGNGASCMQVGPEIQHDVEALTIYQRSKHWAVQTPRSGDRSSLERE